MKRRNTIRVALVGLLAAATWTAVPKLMAAEQSQAPAALPPGHPSLPPQGGSGSLPAGHPQLPVPSGDPGLPAGHPSIGGGPTSRPAAQWGTLILRTFQGTQGAPAVGEDPVIVEFYYRGLLVHRATGKLDATGTTVFQKIPLSTPCQPLVKVKHAGIEYAAIGEILHGYNAAQTLEMNVYETTDKQPAWNIQMRHLMIDPKPDGLDVIELIGLQNPTDRSWIGDSQKDGSKTTFAVSLPAGVTNVKFEGPSDGLKIDKERIVAVSPMQPGLCQIQVSYRLPAGKDGKVAVPISSPVAIGRLMCFVSENGAAATADGLTAAGSQAMENGAKTLLFTGIDFKAGQKATITVTLPKAAKASADSLPPKSDSAHVAKMVAAVGGGIVLVAGTGYVLTRPGTTTTEAKL